MSLSLIQAKQNNFPSNKELTGLLLCGFLLATARLCAAQVNNFNTLY
jgi:hypothetical protein